MKNQIKKYKNKAKKSVNATVTTSNKTKSIKEMHTKMVKQREERKSWDIPLQKAKIEPPKEQLISKHRQSLQIKDIIKETITKQVNDKKEKMAKEIEDQKVQKDLKDKLDHYNQEIRKKNQLRFERLKRSLSKNEIPFDLVPWGVDQSQFNIPTNLNRHKTPRQHSGSRSSRGIDMKARIKKEKLKQRKHSLQNTSDKKRIEIEEKDSIKWTKNKFLIEKSKRTVIYDDNIKKVTIEQHHDSIRNAHTPVHEDRNQPYDTFQKNKLRKNAGDNNTYIKVTFNDRQRSKSARSTSCKRQRSIHSHKEIQDFMENQMKKRRNKERKEYLKEKRKSLKAKRQLDQLNTFVSRKISRHDMYTDRSYDGIVPHHISKRLKEKHPGKSKTPRNNQKIYKLNFNNPYIKGSNTKRGGTTLDFYPNSDKVPYTVFEKTPPNNKQGSNETRFTHFKSFDYSKAQKQPSELSRSATNEGSNQFNFDISQTKFKINPSPFKRREKSIVELIQYLQKHIEDIEKMETKKNKNKHIHGIKPAKKVNKKKGKKKARSHSPNEKTKTPIKTVLVSPPLLKKPVTKAPTTEQLTTIQPKIKSKPLKSQSRNKKGGVVMPKTTTATIEPENRPLKIPTAKKHKIDKKQIKSKGTNPQSKKLKTKAASKKSKVELLKNKMKAILKLNLEINTRAAIVIQRWYRSMMDRQLKMKQKKEALEKIKVEYNTSPHNKDIASLRSSENDVIEKKVIIDIHTDNKDENYHRNRLRKRSKHNFSFGNNMKLEETPEDISISKDTDFERYKRKKRANNDYQFKKRGRNIFDSDKGEDGGEEAYDYYEVNMSLNFNSNSQMSMRNQNSLLKNFNEHYEIMDFDLRKKRKGKQYSKTVNNEEEKKLEFSSHVDNSLARAESQLSNESEHEDRLRRFSEYKNTETNKTISDKKYIIDQFSHNEGEYSENKLSPQDYDDIHKSDGDINNTLDEKLIMISDKYSIEQEQSNEKDKIKKETDSNSKPTSKINIGLRNYYIDDLMVKRPDPTPENEKKSQDMPKLLKKLNIRQPSKDSSEIAQLIKNNPPSPKKEVSNITGSDIACNNLDLNNVRGGSDNIPSENKKSEEVPKDDLNQAYMFSDLSKDYNDTNNQILSNTLDICSLSKLRRMFGSERLVKEYRTSSDMSHFNSSYNGNGLKLYSEDNELIKIYPDNTGEDIFNPRTKQNQNIFEKLRNVKDEQDVTEELKLEDLNQSQLSEDGSNEKALSIQNQLPESLVYHYQNNDNEIKQDDFMDTNELLDLFTSEGIKKTIESGDRTLEQTHTLFDKNPFKDFTMTKMDEILKDKDFDEIQELRKIAVDYRASVEHKLLDKMEHKESPKTLKSRRIELEKWVDHEIKQIENDTDLDDIKQNAINMI